MNHWQFRDNTNYQTPWTGSKQQLVRLIRSYWTDQPGNLYWYRILDPQGHPWQVQRGPRGGLKIVPAPWMEVLWN